MIQFPKCNFTFLFWPVTFWVYLHHLAHCLLLLIHLWFTDSIIYVLNLWLHFLDNSTLLWFHLEIIDLKILLRIDVSNRLFDQYLIINKFHITWFSSQKHIVTDIVRLFSYNECPFMVPSISRRGSHFKCNKTKKGIDNSSSQE